jgi:hypothetical protein
MVMLKGNELAQAVVDRHRDNLTAISEAQTYLYALALIPKFKQTEWKETAEILERKLNDRLTYPTKTV